MVIGAGALGLSTALHCAIAGRSVVVVERHTAGSQASGRAAGLFKSVQADELRTRLARRSITRALTFADWAGVPLPVARSGSFLIARTTQHREYLAQELTQSRRWGADVREAPRTRAQLLPASRRRIRAVVPGGRLHRGAGQPHPGLRGRLPPARGRGGRERGRHRHTGHRGPRGRRGDRAPVDRRAGGRGRGGRLGPAGGRPGRSARTGRPGPSSAADHRAHDPDRPGRPDCPGGRRRRLPAPGPRRADGRRVRARPAAGRPGSAARLVQHR